MIKVVNHKTLKKYGHLLIGQFKLRYKEFVIRQNYDVPSFDGMEYDKYDTPAATYLVFEDSNGIVHGSSRLTPVTNGCMLKDLWPHIVEDKKVFDDPTVWESTRFCINKELPADERSRVCHELAIANVEFGLRHNISKIIGMMPTFILRRVFERSGIFLERLGPVYDIPDFRNVQAAGIPINLDQLKDAHNKTGLKSVISGINNETYLMETLKEAA